MEKPTFLADYQLLTIVLIILSFLPLEPSCVPGNVFLFMSPVIFIAVRFAFNKRFFKEDLVATCVLASLIVFVLVLAAITNCHPTFRFSLQEPQPAWQTVSIEKVDSGGLYITATKSTISTSDLRVYINGLPQQCSWQPFTLYIQPAATAYCALQMNCTSTTQIEVLAPGGKDSTSC